LLSLFCGCTKEAMTTGPDPVIHDDNPPMDAAFLAGTKLSQRGQSKTDAPNVKLKTPMDAKAVEHLRSGEPVWQTRVNALIGGWWQWAGPNEVTMCHPIEIKFLLSRLA
jgi:uncharacterized protein (DUF4415 family)